MIAMPDLACVTGCALVGILYGLLGSFSLARNQALLGDVLSHAAWPGLVLAFGLTGSRNFGALAIGAIMAGLAAIASLDWLSRGSGRIKSDARLALILSGFFGVGMLATRQVQISRPESMGHLQAFLFGQTAALMWSDVCVMGLALVVSVTIVWLRWRDLTVLCFDPEWRKTTPTSGLSTPVILNGILVLGIVAGLPVAGVVLVSALLVCLPVTARVFTVRFASGTILAMTLGGVLGALSPILVMLIESGARQWHGNSDARLPTGPVFVLAGAVCAAIALSLGEWTKKSKKPGKSPNAAY